MKFFILIFILLAFFSCAQIDKRAPSNYHEEISNISIKTLKKSLKSQKSNVEIVKKNLAKFFLYATYKSENEKLEIFKLANAYLTDSLIKLAKNARNHELNLVGEDLEILNPPRWTLGDEVAWMSKELNKDPDLFKDYLSPVLKQVSKIEFESGTEFQGNSFWSQEDFEMFMSALKSDSSDKDVPLASMKIFENKISKYFEKIRNVGTELSNSGKIDFPDAEAKKFFVKFLDYYYSNSDIEVIKNILNDVVDIGREPTQSELISIMFQNSGPGLGKTLQQLSKEPNVGDSLKQLVGFLEDDGKQVPHYLIEELVAKDKAKFKLSHISKEALGTGTMAQVNKAKLQVNGESIDVALRFLKPGIEVRVDDDLKILAGFVEQMVQDGEFSDDFIPSARKLVNSISQFLRSELSITDAIKKQDFAHKVYTRQMQVEVGKKKIKIDIKVPNVYYPENGKETKLHVQEFIQFGEKYSKIKESNIQEAVARAITTTWFDEGLLKSGFIHSDLHQGNFTVRNITADSAEIVLFDFGMSETLSKETRQSFILIGAGAELRRATLIAEGIILMDKEEYTAQMRKDLVQQISGQMDKIDRPEDWIVWALKEGFLKNDQIGTLARGGVLVSQLGKIIGKDEMRKEIVEKLLAKNALSAFAGSSEFPLTRLQVLKIGIGSCLQSIKSFFGK